jgi:hypothetical protein
MARGSRNSDKVILWNLKLKNLEKQAQAAATLTPLLTIAGLHPSAKLDSSLEGSTQNKFPMTLHRSTSQEGLAHLGS